MVLEPLAHKTLADFIGSDLLLSVRLRAAHHLAQGLRHIHSKGVIHRDIKPSNLLIVEDPFCLLVADFGHATTEAESADHEKGTLPYLPPEIVALKTDRQIRDRDFNSIDDSRHYWTPKADVFAFGLVLFELLVKPFPRNSRRMLDGRIHGEILEVISEQPPVKKEFKAFLEGVLCWEPDGRPTMIAVCLDSVWPSGFLETSMNELKRKVSQ